MIAVIFDQDGVIVNTSTVHFEAWRRIFHIYNINLTYDIYKKRMAGRKAIENIKTFLGNRPEEEIKNLLNKKNDYFKELFDLNLHAVQGIKSFLKELKDNKVPTAIASSSRKVIVDFVLDQIGIKEYFDVIVTGEDVQKAKPDPFIYFLTAKKLNIDSTKCVVFEDSIAGVMAAKNARMKVVLLTTTHKKQEIKETVDRVIENFDSIHYNEIISLF